MSSIDDKGSSLVSNFLIALLKQATNFTFLISAGKSSQVLSARWDSVSEPKVTYFIALA